MNRLGWLLLSGVWLLVLEGCTCREKGSCEKDFHCEGAKVCFESKCLSMKELEQIKAEREAADKPKECQDNDGDGFSAGDGCEGMTTDCNDQDPEMAPGKTEICDEVDNNCDGRVNEGMQGCVQTLFGGATWGTQKDLRLENPRSIVYDPAGYVLVTDNHHVWKIDLEGRATILAGSHISHYADGAGVDARFSYPAGLTKDLDGGWIVADCKNNCVRKINADATVSTLAGLCSPLTKNANQFADGDASSARFYCPVDVWVNVDGAKIVVDRENARIRKINSDGDVSTIAGVGPVEIDEGEGQVGFQDGPAGEARFNDPQSVLVDAKGIVYVSESFNCRIRRIDPQKNIVSTLAGESDTMLGMGGYKDGRGAGAKFNYPHGMVFDPQGNLLVADTGNAVIRRVTPAGVVTTVFGKPGKDQYQDGPIENATFQTPTDLALGPNGSLLVVDTVANRVRWIVPK